MIRNRLIKKAVFCTMALVLVAAPVMLASCKAAPAPTTTVTATATATVAPASIKIGLSLCYTGPAGEKGRVMSDGILDSLKYINEELGGVNGHKIEVNWQDNQYDTAKSVTILNDLMNSGSLMFATNDSTTMKASMETANRNNFPGIAVFSSPELTNPAKHIYAQLPDYGDDWAAFANYYMTNIWKGAGKPKMALLLLNNPTGAGAKQAAQVGAEKIGIEIIATEEHAATTTSEIEALTRVKAKNPDVIYISSTPAPTAVILKNMASLDMVASDKLTIGLNHAAMTSALVTLAGDNKFVEGVYGVYPTVTWDENVPGMAKMAEYLNKQHPQDKGNMDYITTWAEGLIIAEAIRLAIQNSGTDKLTPALLETNGIQKLKNFDPGGLQGPVSYNAGDNRLSTSLRIFKISAGKISPITSWIQAPKMAYAFGQ